MYPMKMVSVYKEYIWGGINLNKYFNKTNNSLKTAESWELSCCDDGLSIISNGVFRGKTLKEIVKINPNFLGNKILNNFKFPLLIKLIDAQDKLSIQVHPSDELADKTKNQQGKTEAWYILDCEPNAFLYLGFKDDISKSILKEKINNGKICNYLNKVFVKPGDVFLISPGTVHAIGAGILIAEIQQNSNTTFRLFDYNRTDSNGNKRPLHIDESIRVCNSNKYLPNIKQSNLLNNTQNFRCEQLVECKYFKVLKYKVISEINLEVTTNSFQAILFINGEGNIKFKNSDYNFIKGDCYFLPSNMGEYNITGNCEFLISEI